MKTMDTVHALEKNQFITLFRQEQIDNIDKRLQVLEAFLSTEQHISINDLAELMKKKNTDCDISFINDTMALLCRFGFAQKTHFNDGQILYEHRHIGHHHDHMICTKCGEIEEFINPEMETLQAAIATKAGFHMLQHKMEIYGICSHCLKKRAATPLMPLMLAKPGEKMILREFAGNCDKMHARLASMGLRKGDVIEIITSQGHGQFVIASGPKRFVLGRGMSRKMYVEPQ